MEINFETLKRCHNCRFEAEYTGLYCDQNDQTGAPIHGMVHVPDMDDGINLFFSPQGRFADWRRFYDRCGYKYARYITDVGLETTFPDIFLNFRIVPRNPDTYRDWQVGDHVAMPDSNDNIPNNYVIIIFRAGELVIFKRPMADGRWAGYSSYTCDELFESGWRLVLTDIEKQIIEEEKAAEDVPGFHALKRLAPVLVRDRNASTWKAAVFDRVEPEHDYPFLMLSETRWKQCAPLNEETAGYLGTTEKIPNQCGKE